MKSNAELDAGQNAPKELRNITYPKSIPRAGEVKVVAGTEDAKVRGSEVEYKPNAAALGVEQLLELSDGAVMSTGNSGK
jgi:hypothetical protein